jgi:hypothetical protein
MPAWAPSALGAPSHLVFTEEAHMGQRDPFVSPPVGQDLLQAAGLPGPVAGGLEAVSSTSVVAHGPSVSLSNVPVLKPPHVRVAASGDDGTGVASSRMGGRFPLSTAAGQDATSPAISTRPRRPARCG